MSEMPAHRSAPYPLHTGERKALRVEFRSAAMARAELQARTMGRSLKCAADNDWNHAGTPGGCTNDGTGCICECHDPEGAT